MAFLAISKYSALVSRPMLARPIAVAAAIVEPDPMKGSRITPSPNGRAARTICRRNAWGFSDGCGASRRSSPRAGDE